MNASSSRPSELDKTSATRVVETHKPSPFRAQLRAIVPDNAYLHVYTWCTICVSICGFSFGFDTSSIGPITLMPQFEALYSPISPTLQGLIVSSILITASISSFTGASLSDKISRTYTISSCLLAASSKSLAQLFVGRGLAGLGEGLFMSTTTVYVCEIAPANVRGRLACIFQLFITFGVATGYFVCFGTVRIPSSLAWRLPFSFQAGLSFAIAASVPFLPHSPRWLKHIGRTQDAEHAWARLGFSAAEVEKEEERLERVENEVTPSGPAPEVKTPWYKLDLFGRDVRLRTFLGCLLMGMQQATGIDGVLYYAPVLFSQAGLSSSTSSFLASGVSGLLNVFCTIVALFFMDKWGRRPTILWGGSIIAFAMLSIGTLYASGATDHSAGRWAVVGFIYLFIIAFSMSWAVVNRMYCSEIQPTKTRAAATSLGQCFNWIVNWTIAFSTPLFLARSSYGPYFMFGSCTLFTVLVCIALMPESKGLTLEALDEVFKSLPWTKMVMKLKGQRIRRNGSEDDIQLHPITATRLNTAVVA
ncbi:general substrate transporter [Flagelloscypha sp. PMI_526]|nr:general substrate transporter [Flagelloscypha sp. PMI_526]